MCASCIYGNVLELNKISMLYLFVECSSNKLLFNLK